jgi:hypothetical protein
MRLSQTNNMSVACRIAALAVEEAKKALAEHVKQHGCGKR